MTDKLAERFAAIRFVPRYSCTRGELIADGIVHGVGLALAVSASSVLLALAAFHAAGHEYLAAIFYVASLLTALSLSCAYNMVPLSRAKRLLRRFDHAGIYLLIAGTYTAFLAQMANTSLAWTMFWIVWGAAGLGMALKLFLPGRFDRLAVVFYLALGWCGIAVARSFAASLPQTALWLILAGGVAYSTGVVFYLRPTLRYNTALWHGFVLAGVALHLAAVMDSLVIARF
jgi:hemolysin III